MTKSTSIYDECISPSMDRGHMKYTSSCPAALRVSKKYATRRKLQRKEYKNLKKVLPSISSSPKVSKRDIIEEAIKYIDYLHGEIANRFYTNGVFKSNKEDSPVADCVKRLLLFPDAIDSNNMETSSSQIRLAQCNQRVISNQTTKQSLNMQINGQYNRSCNQQQGLLLSGQQTRKYSTTDVRLRI